MANQCHCRIFISESLNTHLRHVISLSFTSFMVLSDKRYLAPHKGCVMRNYKKIIGYLLVSSMSLLLALTWFTGYQSDCQLAQWLQIAGQTPGIATSWFDQEKNLFSRKAELHLMIADPTQLLAISPYLKGDNQVYRWLQHVGPTELYIELQQHIFPGFIRGTAHINQHRGSYSDAADLPTIPHQMYWQINGFSGAIVAGVNIEQWNWLRDDKTWLVAPLHAQLELPDAQQAVVSVLWQGMQWRDDHTEEKGNLKSASFHTSMTKHDGLWLMPQIDLVLDQLSLQQQDRQLQLTQWHWQSVIAENRDGLLSVVDVSNHSSIDSLSYHSQQNDYQLSDLNTGFTLGGVNRAGFESLLVNSGLDATNLMKWKAGLNLITRSGVQFRLEPFDLKLNRQPLSMHGQLTTRPFDVSQVHGIESMRSLLQGDLSVDVAQSVTQQYAPLAFALPDLLSDGYIEQGVSGRIATKIRMVNGKLSANGVAVPY